MGKSGINPAAITPTEKTFVFATFMLIRYSLRPYYESYCSIIRFEKFDGCAVEILTKTDIIYTFEEIVKLLFYYY